MRSQTAFALLSLAAATSPALSAPVASVAQLKSNKHKLITFQIVLPTKPALFLSVASVDS